jgi:hypothetical protein
VPNQCYAQLLKRNRPTDSNGGAIYQLRQIKFELLDQIALLG